MIIVRTHKCDKSPFKHSKTIYVFTSGRVIVTIQIHSRRKAFKGVKNDHCKMDHEYQRAAAGFAPILLQDLMKMDVCRCGVGDCPYSHNFVTLNCNF
jgi:hypothetical protein